MNGAPEWVRRLRPWKICRSSPSRCPAAEVAGRDGHDGKVTRQRARPFCPIYPVETEGARRWDEESDPRFMMQRLYTLELGPPKEQPRDAIVHRECTWPAVTCDPCHLRNRRFYPVTCYGQTCIAGANFSSKIICGARGRLGVLSQRAVDRRNSRTGNRVLE